MMNKNKKIILTGDRPTGKLHLGHYVGSLENRVKMQGECQQFIIIADVQALTDHAKNSEAIKDNIVELFYDYLAVGIDPKKSTIFIQSLVPEIAELTMYYLNLVTVSRLERNPTTKEEIKQKGFEKSLPAGFFMYPVSQAADITAFKADYVPVGEDQLPMIEQTNDIVKKFNSTYNTKCLKVAKAIVSKTPRLPGIDGSGKMSKSLGNAIYLSDNSETISKKVMSMFTDPNHIKVEDPGEIEGNAVFAYLDAFDPDQEGLKKLKEYYQRGGLGDIEVKKRLDRVLQSFIGEIRERRKKIEKRYPKEAVMKELEFFSKRARTVASRTLQDVKRAMKIDYL